MPATDEYWRSLPKTHKVFAVSAFVLLATIVLMMYKDEARPWREIQSQAEEYRVERLEKQLAEFDNAEYQAQLEKSQQAVAKAESSLTDKQDELAKQRQQLKEMEGRLQILARDSKAANAYRDKARADYDIAVRDEVPAAELQKAYDLFQARADAASAKALELQRLTSEYDALKSEINATTAKLTNAQAELTSLQADQVALQEQRNELRPESTLSSWKRWFKEWPIINGFNPHLKIQYDWPSDLKQTLGMARVSRVDRCRTCHVNITEFGAGDVLNYPLGEYPQPYCSHPDPNLFLTATSPHPVTKFGCTICHEGDGSGTAFQTAEHTAANPAVAAEWKEEYDWHENHFWEYPMFPKQFTESGCLKCHHKVVELGINEEYGASAPKLYKGYSLIRDYGCFGCHEINGYDGTQPIGPDLRLEPQTPEEVAKYAADPKLIAGEMRKVGPSLRHIGEKVPPEFIAYWTQEPKRFRPDTRMPQFFGLTNQHDNLAEVLQPIELAAIATYLTGKSQTLELQSPRKGYEPNVERGLELFKKRGCLACHSRKGEEFEGIAADFGPDLSRIHEKLLPGEQGFRWLYTWVREPTTYHSRTKMPDLFLDPYEEDGTYIDPAADIAAYLLQGEPMKFPALADAKPYLGVALDPDFTLEDAKKLGILEDEFRGVKIDDTLAGGPAERASVQQAEEKWAERPLIPGDVIVSLNGQAVTSPEQFAQLVASAGVNSTVTAEVIHDGLTDSYRLTVSTPLDDLMRLYLSKALTASQVDQVFEERHYPVSEKMYAKDAKLSDFIKGDEIELAPKSLDEKVSDEDWQRRKLTYLGRRTISRYGCYGCHDIPGFETARPIGTALQDWGRKDTSKLAYEHIHEFLHHHGEPDGSSTAERLNQVVRDAKAGEDVPDQELVEAYLYESVISHGRAGFLWQKLRQPRSYDYKKIETKGWDERLRMPKFPFSPDDIEAISTFVLGLVNDPPAPDYLYRPEGPKGDIIEGERLLTKYNCTGCHMVEMPVWEFGVVKDDLYVPPLAEGEEPEFALFKDIKPPIEGFTGETLESGEPILRVTAYPQRYPDPLEDPEFQMYSLVLWDAVDLGDGRTMMPGQPLPVSVPMIHGKSDGRGGTLAQWLIPQLPGNEKGVKDLNEAWQAAPPPLVGEGHKVQTPWLYQFLKNPEQLRYTTVLRMPRFNMDDDEARALANYFSARDGAAYPYQSIPQRQAAYQHTEQQIYQEQYPDAKEENYLTASWMVLNGPLCRKCHSVGGNVVTETDPSKVKRGPNLQRVENRIRPEYAEVWIHNPKWILPYTSMPQNFPPGAKAAITEYFDGKNARQEEAVIDALFNYTRLIEAHGPTTYDPPGTPAEGEQPPETGNEPAPSTTLLETEEVTGVQAGGAE